MTTTYPGLSTVNLSPDCDFSSGVLPDSFSWNSAQFDLLWDARPQAYHEILMRGRLVKTPRWQQAYGADYHYTGRVNSALPTPSLLSLFLAWAKEAIDDRLNGILVNWYDLSLGHYIGKHRDSRANMFAGSPIVTISLGTGRTFRLRPWKGA